MCINKEKITVKILIIEKRVYEIFLACSYHKLFLLKFTLGDLNNTKKLQICHLVTVYVDVHKVLGETLKLTDLYNWYFLFHLIFHISLNEFSSP